MMMGAPVPTITPSYTGFLNSETPSVLSPQPTRSTTATSASAIGSYPSKCAGAADSNHVISYTGGTVNVTYLIPALFSETSSKNSGSTVTIKRQLKNYAGMDLS
jgi:hypothetical protein